MLNATNLQVDEINKQIKESKLFFDEKNNEINFRQNKIEEDEKTYQLKVEDFNNKSIKLLEEQEIIKTAKEAFLKAIETVYGKII